MRKYVKRDLEAPTTLPPWSPLKVSELETSNTPSAPHQLGVWERVVRSFKHISSEFCRNRRLTNEFLSTTLCLDEQCLNAPPLTPASTDAMDLNAHTTNNIFCFELLVIQYRDTFKSK